MGSLRHLPTADRARRLVDATLDDLRDLVAEELKKALHAAPRAEGLVPTRVIAATYGKHVDTVRKWKDRGCPCHQRGRLILWDPQEVDAWWRDAG
ncbi:MAG: hypothetical protein AAGF92_15025 [Myxococcota bacterium]